MAPPARFLPWLALSSSVALAAPVRAEPVWGAVPTLPSRAVAEQVVARVDGQPILLSELRARARPSLRALDADPPWRRAIARREAYRALIERQIEEALLARVAVREGVAVTDAEITDAIARVATEQHTSAESLLAQALAAGYDVRAYRDEVRRQLLEHKVLWTVEARRSPAAARGRAFDARRLADLRARVLDQERRRACVEHLARF